MTVLWRQISSPYSNGMTFKFKVKYKWGIDDKNMFYVFYESLKNMFFNVFFIF